MSTTHVNDADFLAGFPAGTVELVSASVAGPGPLRRLLLRLLGRPARWTATLRFRARHRDA